MKPKKYVVWQKVEEPYDGFTDENSVPSQGEIICREVSKKEYNEIQKRNKEQVKFMERYLKGSMDYKIISKKGKDET